MLVTFSWANPNPLNPLISSSHTLHQLLHPETSWKTINGWVMMSAIFSPMPVVCGENNTPHERHIVWGGPFVGITYK